MTYVSLPESIKFCEKHSGIICWKLENCVACNPGTTVSTPHCHGATHPFEENIKSAWCFLQLTNIFPSFLCHSKKTRTISLYHSQVALKALWTTQHINDLLFINYTHWKAKWQINRTLKLVSVRNLPLQPPKRTKARHSPVDISVIRIWAMRPLRPWVIIWLAFFFSSSSKKSSLSS